MFTVRNLIAQTVRFVAQLLNVDGGFLPSATNDRTIDGGTMPTTAVERVLDGGRV